MQQSHLITHCLEWSDWMCHHWACGAHQTRKRGRYAGRKNHRTETLTDPRAIKYCSVLHVCWNKPKQPSSLRDGWWWHRSVSRALGLLLGINKQNQQWVLAAKGAYGILGCVSKRKVVWFCCSAQHLLGCTWYTLPSCGFHIIRETLNNWERAIRMVSMLKKWMYKEGLKELGLLSLKYRSLEGKQLNYSNMKLINY